MNVTLVTLEAKTQTAPASWLQTKLLGTNLKDNDRTTCAASMAITRYQKDTERFPETFAKGDSNWHPSDTSAV